MTASLTNSENAGVPAARSEISGPSFFKVNFRKISGHFKVSRV